MMAGEQTSSTRLPGRCWGLTLAVLLCAPAAPRAAAGQQPAATASDARAVAAAVQAFYDQTTDISARFHQTYVHKLYNRTDKSQGSVIFKKPGKMRWDYDRPNGKVIVSNGQRLLVYEPGEQSEGGQVIEQKIGEAQLPQAMGFLMGTGKLEQDFTFRLLDGKKQGYQSGYVLELRPTRPTPHYARILLYVERATALRGLVRRLLIIDESGNRNRFDFSVIKFNGKVADSTFNWQPPAGTRRVTM
jgi:outer membrane lipoprotein carrier protein